MSASSPTPRRQDQAFGQALDVLRRFAAREGHARVPASHVEAGFPLGSWVSLRRRDYQAGRLLPEHATALETIPGWTWQPWEDDFLRGLTALQRFADREGHLRVPKAHLEDGVPLAGWIRSRRRNYVEGRLTPARVAALEAVEGWSWAPYRRRRT